MLLAEVCGAVQDALEVKAPGRAGVCRGVLHLAGEHGAAGVLIVEAEGAGGPEGLRVAGADLQSSRLALQHVRDRGEAVILDVNSRRLELPDGSLLRLQPEQVRARTVVRLERAQVSHLLAMPLRRPDGTWIGMVSVEIRHPQAAGQRLGLHPLVLDALQPLLDLGELFLARLPRARPRADGARASMGGALARCCDLAVLMVQRGEPALLLGPAGVGKSWLARQVARQVAPSGVMESFDASSLTEGTLLGALASLDALIVRHVERLRPETQARLARWLGSPRERACAILLTSRCKSFELEREGALHADLWSLLRPHTVWLAPLAERVDDIDGIVQAALAERAEARRLPTAGLAEASLALLRETRLPDNAIGLRNLAFRALLEAEARHSGEGQITIEAEDVARALEQLRPRSSDGLLEQLRPGLRQLVERASAAGVTLRDLDGLAGAVVAEALAQDGDALAVARRFGYRGPRRGGNHLKLLRPPAEQLRALCERLGEPTPEALRLLDVSNAGRGSRHS